MNEPDAGISELNIKRVLNRAVTDLNGMYLASIYPINLISLEHHIKTGRLTMRNQSHILISIYLLVPHHPIHCRVFSPEIR